MSDDLERELDRLKCDTADDIEEVAKVTSSLVSKLADEINQLAMVVETILPPGGRKVELRDALIRVRERVAPLILDPDLEREPLEEYTILHHVRARNLDEALRLAGSLAESRALAQSDSEIAATHVTAGVRELRQDRYAWLEEEGK